MVLARPDEREVKLRKTELLAVGEARKVILWPTSGLKERTYDSSRVLAEGIYDEV